MRTLRAWIGAFSLVLAGCATSPPGGAPALPLADHLFEPVPVMPAETLFRLDDAMQAHVDRLLRAPHRGELARLDLPSPAHRLVRSLAEGGQMRLDYDASRTRTAQEAFHDRAGNCLSLVILTAAFADALGLEVRFQSVPVTEAWERQGDLHFYIGHINLAIATRPMPVGSAGGPWREWLVVDFLPGADLRRQRHEPIERHRVVAMFMNNRAAELLAQGRLDAAYAWAREALKQDAAFGGAANTLGVVYLRRGEPVWAERALRHALSVAGADAVAGAHAWGNLALALQRQGRDDEARQALAQWQRLQPVAPFEDLLRAQQAMRDGDWDQARRLVQRELTRMPDQHELHFWLAVALSNLGQDLDAARHLERAIEQATSLQQSAAYASKRAWLRGQPLAGSGPAAEGRQQLQ